MRMKIINKYRHKIAELKISNKELLIKSNKGRWIVIYKGLFPYNALEQTLEYNNIVNGDVNGDV